MRIDFSEEHSQNASFSIERSLEFGSNVTVLSEVQDRKDSLARISIEAGRQIDWSEKH
jgi:hypothetical protein